MAGASCAGNLAGTDIQPGTGSGLNHSQHSTAAMHPQASVLTHQRLPAHSKMAAQADMASVAFHLARRLTRPPACQSRISWPNTLWSNSQRCSRGELRAAAQAAISTNTVVGRPGTNRPTTPVASDTQASSSNSQRHGAGTGCTAGAPAAGLSLGRGSSVGMAGLHSGPALLGRKRRHDRRSTNSSRMSNALSSKLMKSKT